MKIAGLVKIRSSIFPGVISTESFLMLALITLKIRITDVGLLSVRSVL